MQKAFKLGDHDGEDEGASTDDENDSDEPERLAADIPTKRLACFAHTLQLAIGDGLKENKEIINKFIQIDYHIIFMSNQLLTVSLARYNNLAQ